MRKDGADADRSLIGDRVLACVRTNSVGYARPGVFSKVAGVSLERMGEVRVSAHGVRPRAESRQAI